MKWIEIQTEKAIKEGGCVPATIHYHEPKEVWLKPIDESPSPSLSAEQEAREYADGKLPNANATDAPYCTTGERWDEVYAAYLAGKASAGDGWIRASEKEPEESKPFIMELGNKYGFFEYAIGLYLDGRFVQVFDDGENAGHYPVHYVTRWKPFL